MRLTEKELEKVKSKYGVDRLYSWSKINTFMTSHYEYFLKYVLHKKEDYDNAAYATLGGMSHNVLENYYENEIEYDEMLDKFLDSWTTAIDIADLKFDRNDESKNESIKERYKENLIHFFKNHKIIEKNIMIERFMSAKIGDYALQGYVDAIFKDDDGNFNIIDWKTSSKYSGKSAEEKCGQLVVYAIGLNQQGVDFDKIKIAWNFLKYCTITITQKNGKKKDRIIERSKIGESLKANAKAWLNEYNYDVDKYLNLLVETNSIDCLPDKVKDTYMVNDCYVYIPLTDKLIKKWEDIIITTIKDIELRENDYEETHNEKIFWDSNEQVRKESYYFSTLCGYSAALLKPYAEYLQKLEDRENGKDIFNGVGNATDDGEIIESTGKNVLNDNDLSWLNDL